MLDLFEKRTSELSNGLDEQAKQIEALQQQLQKLAKEHQSRSEAIAHLNQSKEEGQELIDCLRRYLEGLKKIDPDFVDSFVGRINEVVFGATGTTASRSQKTTPTSEPTTEPTSESAIAFSRDSLDAPSSVELEPESPSSIPGVNDEPEIPEPKQVSDIEEGTTVKVLTDKFGTEGEVGEVKTIVEKPSGTKFKVKLPKGLFTFLEHEIEKTSEQVKKAEPEEIETMTLPY